MKNVFIDAIAKDSDFEDDMFMEILNVDDVIERTKYIEDVRRKCKSVGRITEFNNLLKAWIQRNAQLLKQADSNTTDFTDAPLTLKCGKYTADDTGVSISEVTKTGDVFKIVACPHPILPVERLINIDTDTEKLKIAFFKDARWRSITIDCGVVFNKNNISQLADRGVIVTSESAKDLVKYIAETVSLNMDKIPLYRSVSRLGWIADEFAPYVTAVKYDGDEDFRSIYEHVTEAGTYETWLDHIGQLRQDINIRMMLAASFGSVLIQKIGGLPFVLHLWGTTGFGKTVSLMVAASVWGDPDMGKLTRTMNMTANAMARTSAFLYNIPFCADELQQIKNRWENYDSLIIYLCEGIDRGRAKARGGIEELKTWRNAFIFTGEEPVTKACSGGGVKNRVIEIEVKDKIIPDGNKTANLVKENYGHAGKRFIEYIQTLKTEDIQAAYKEIFTEIVETTDTTEKQAMSMATMLLADKYASECIFKGSQPLSVEDVRGFLVSAKTVDMTVRAYDWTVNWIAENSIRFELNPEDNRGAIWGKIDDDVATINKNVLIAELNKAGFDFFAVSRKWAERGKIIKNSQGFNTHQTAVNGIKANYIKLRLPDSIEEIPAEMPTPFD